MNNPPGTMVVVRLDPQVKTLRDVTVDQFHGYKDGLDPVIQKRCQFIIEENQRVLQMESALKNQVLDQVLDLSRQSYLGARDLYEIGSDEDEYMMAGMISGPGVVGARQAGAGFGGCMVAFVRRDQVGPFVTHVKKQYVETTSIEPHVYAVREVDGAGILD